MASDKRESTDLPHLALRPTVVPLFALLLTENRRSGEGNLSTLFRSFSHLLFMKRDMSNSCPGPRCLSPSAAAIHGRARLQSWTERFAYFPCT